MKQTQILSLVFSIFAMLELQAQKTPEMKSDQDGIFPKGKKASSENMTGNVWLHVLTPGDSTFDYHIANVTFEPGARTRWHSHPGGQMLIVTEGIGYYQEKGKPVQTLRKGDVVKCLPNVEHWHGATPKNEFIHIGITNTTPKGIAVWLQPVDEKEYNSLKE